jgi:hypothetical protein
MPLALPQCRHAHNLNDQARPAGKVLCSLAFACLWVILLPCEARLSPRVEDRVYEVLAEAGVQIASFGGVGGGGGLCDSLDGGY